jgi:hypothetical protein
MLQEYFTERLKKINAKNFDGKLDFIGILWKSLLSLSVQTLKFSML